MDVSAIGELLIDFTPGAGPGQYVSNPGGAPANVLVQLHRLGCDAAFLGMVGSDFFGDFLRETLEHEGVETQGLRSHPSVPTTLAFVHIGPDGDRDFTFYRNPGADIMLTPEDLDTALIDKATIFHFGGVSLSREPAREATMAAARRARDHGKLVSFDPNYRAMLWESPEEAAVWMRKGIPLCDVLKISDEEAVMATGVADLPRAADQLAAAGPSLVLVTMGPRGCLLHHRNLSTRFPTYDTVVVDTTGSGDSFMGAALYQLLRCGGSPAELSADQLATLCHYANAAGATCAAGYGAIPSMPDDAAIQACIDTVPLLELKKV